MTTSTVAKNTQKLQRAVVDGLEDVKAQDIVVFDTEHLSALFERVIIASGTSNRQTKALAASVRDAVREAGFAKPRIEGEGNGEWIIVDCNQVVVHIMQPNFRQYYHLEELWGEKPVRLKLGAAKPVVAKASEEAKPAAKKAAAKAVEPSMRRSSAAKKGVEEAFPSKAALKKAADKAAGVKAPAKKAASKTTAAKPAAKPTVKAAVKTVVVKPEVKKTVAKKAAAKPAAAKKAPAKKAAPRKA
ncbi:ribosome silencing factor [Rhodoferax sp. TBRC 17660]|uniref:Ribosomal silencing factor RsfS n=1 Tax=Rhodoferax potami TaxID=3068338 RepID=A0ABU3KHL5_9BURK|nr:ribosome silencing factor [Rhodoferax sp. TBRC 17660]MDT7517254.1 ribosome silencing factor [Rhodoferax sp. TBRC 17660]